jgi:hypothetical protein
MKPLITVFFILIISIGANSQPPSKDKDSKNPHFGFKAGAVYSSITDISKTLVSESYYTGYTFDNYSKWGFTGGIFINYKFEETISAIYSEISYSRLGNKLHYSDVEDLNYDLLIKYEYINWELWYKVYILGGLHFGIGSRLGFNITPGALYYTSNGEDRFGPDIRIQQQMRDVLKGRTDFSAGIGAGYEIPNGFCLDIRYYYGISDVIETEVNNFHFIENKNSSRMFQITLGIPISYDFRFF